MLGAIHFGLRYNTLHVARSDTEGAGNFANAYALLA